MTTTSESATPVPATSESSALLTDLYQLTMLQAWHDQGVNPSASFEFYCRALPAGRNFLVAAGLDSVLEWLEQLRVQPSELDWLAGTGRFTDAFLRSLESLRFTGEVWAMPEGTPCFPDEPMLRVTAPMREAQLIESRVLNLLHLQTLLASKAVRCVLAAPGRRLVDFGMRRAHGAEAAMLAARSSFLAGFEGTATVLAGQRYGIPIFGTMAHAYVQAHASEAEAFERFARSQPGNASLLIDTWDTLQGARRVVEVARRLAPEGIRILGVRIDSGDLAEQARQVRAILDAGGLQEATIMASGNLDEERIARLLEMQAPIDAFGVGTRVDTSADAPYLECAYKLVEFGGRPSCKRSPGKVSRPGCKQVWRHFDAAGVAQADVVDLADAPARGEPLLRQVMRGGRRCQPAPTLAAVREHLRQQLDTLPPALRGLGAPPQAYTVGFGAALSALAARCDGDAG